MKPRLSKTPVRTMVANLTLELPAPTSPALNASQSEALLKSQTSANKDERPWTSSDAFTLYIREIGQTQLLTPAEEVQLSRRIKKGDLNARETMIKANLRLVVKIARDYEHSGLPLLDLVSEGNIGLMTAVDRFDPRKGAKLSTYAAYWIKQSIRRALANQSRTIRLPVHVVDKLWHIRRAQAQLWVENGREPTDQELSDELHITTRRIGAFRSAAVAPSSLDAPMSDGESHSFSEIIPDEKAFTPSQELAHKMDANMVREVIKGLDSREQGILEARFGLKEAEGQTLDEIGKTFGVTRERIRQIQEAALIKLRRKITALDSIQQIIA
jgi:RNA polymerase primary sigma factor